jgi:hypothetical protein
MRTWGQQWTPEGPTSCTARVRDCRHRGRSAPSPSRRTSTRRIDWFGAFLIPPEDRGHRRRPGRTPQPAAPPSSLAAFIASSSKAHHGGAFGDDWVPIMVIPCPQRIEAGVVDPAAASPRAGHVVPVFLSYAHEDKHLARALAERLELRGCQVWIDEGEDSAV